MQRLFSSRRRLPRDACVPDIERRALGHFSFRSGFTGGGFLKLFRSGTSSANHLMKLADLGPLPLSIIASLVVTVLLLAVRIFVMQRIQTRRQRENRQETERLKSLVAAYRSLAGSFSPVTGQHRTQLEEALSDVVLFGSIRQVELAAMCAMAITRGEDVTYQPLIDDLRAELRIQLGLEPIPKTLELPTAGPGSAQRGRGEGAGGGGGRAGGGGGGGGLGDGAAGAGGIGAGMIAADAMDPPQS